MESLQKMSHVEIRGAMTYLSTQITKTTDEAEKKALNEQFQKVFALYTEKLESAPKDSSHATTITTDYQTRHLTTLLSDVPFSTSLLDLMRTMSKRLNVWRI